MFEYHGAEHKVISCYEAGDAARCPSGRSAYSRLHMRCGTSFLLIVMIIAVFVFAPIGRPALHWLILSRIARASRWSPGLAYEVIRWAGRNRRKRWVRGLMWPGLQLQKLTTREPSLDQLAVVDRGARGGARGREPGRVERGGPPRHGSRGLSAARHGSDATVIERLIEQIEQRYRELTEQLADPETIADRDALHGASRAATASSSEAHELARSTGAPRATRPARRSCSRAATASSTRTSAASSRRCSSTRARADGGARGGAAPRDGRARPERRQERDRRDPGRRRRRRGGAVRRRPLPDADQVRRAARLQDRGARPQRLAGGRLQGGHVRGQGRRRVQRVQVRGRACTACSACPQTESQGRIHTSTATVAVLPEAEDVEVADRPERPPDRRLPLLRPRRAVGQHDRLGGADHAQADRPRGLDAGREVAAPEPRARDARAARAPVRARAARAAGGAGGRPPRAGRHRRALGEGAHLQLSRRAGSPTTASSSPRTTSSRCSRATWTSSPTRSPPTSAAASSKPRRPDEPRRDLVEATSPLRDALAEAVETLEAAGVDTPRLDAEVLLAAVLGVDRAALHADPQQRTRHGRGAARSTTWCAAACGASPSPTSSAARTSASSSWSWTTACWSRGPETELLVELAENGQRVLDVGTGSGRDRARDRPGAPGRARHRHRQLARRDRRRARERRARSGSRSSS